MYRLSRLQFARNPFRKSLQCLIIACEHNSEKKCHQIKDQVHLSVSITHTRAHTHLHTHTHNSATQATVEKLGNKRLLSANKRRVCLFDKDLHAQAVSWRLFVYVCLCFPSICVTLWGDCAGWSHGALPLQRKKKEKQRQRSCHFKVLATPTQNARRVRSPRRTCLIAAPLARPRPPPPPHPPWQASLAHLSATRWEARLPPSKRTSPRDMVHHTRATPPLARRTARKSGAKTERKL